ncbi:MAG: hypothetical protein AB7H90_03460 [Alphaproteobacteria bacterium]
MALSDRLIDARLAGHGWEEIDDFLTSGEDAALAEGYTRTEIDRHLGRTEPDQRRLEGDLRQRLGYDDQLSAAIANAKLTAPLTPLEQPSAERVVAYARIDNLPVIDMPPESLTEVPPSGISFNDPLTRSAYARSLFDDNVRSPRDFAERYTGALAALGTGGVDALVRSAGELAASLPTDRDFIDQAIAIAGSTGVALSPDGVKTIRNNLLNHWADTGEDLQETYKRAWRDPEFREEITKKPDDTISQLGEVFVGAPMALLEWFRGTNLGARDMVGGATQLVANSLPTGIVDTVNEWNNTLAAQGFPLAPVPQGGIDAMEKERLRILEAAGDSFENDWPRWFGQVGATLPFASSLGLRGLWGVVAAGATEGAAFGAFKPETAEDYWSAKAKSIATESATGAVGGAALVGFGKAISAMAPKAAEMLGNIIGRMEEPKVNVLDLDGSGTTDLPASEVFGTVDAATDGSKTYAQKKDIIGVAVDNLARIGDDQKDRYFGEIAARLGNDIHVGGRQPGLPTIAVWHVSPHDFIRFDNSKIGTGEGNAGHGKGMYFAENPEVHEFYRGHFARSVPENFDINMLSDGGQVALREDYNGDVFKYYNYLVGIEIAAQNQGLKMLSLSELMTPALFQDFNYLKNIKWTDAKLGNSYRVNIHIDEDRLFELDKPIGRQSENTRAIVEKLAAEYNISPTTDVASGEAIPWGTLTGRDFYNELVFALGKGDNEKGEIAATEALRKAGFDGNKYLDGDSRRLAEQIDVIKENLAQSRRLVDDPETPEGSRKIHENLVVDYTEQLRKAENPTHNYVVFDDTKIDIMEINGALVLKNEVQRQVEAVAEGRRTADGVVSYLTDTFRDIMQDESGALRLGSRFTREGIDKDLYKSTRLHGQHDIIRFQGEGHRLKAMAEHKLDPTSHIKQLATGIDNAFATLRPYMKEWEDELAKGINGAPMGTQIGKLIDYMEGRSMGYALPHNSKLGPVADTFRDIFTFAENEMRAADAAGIINAKSYNVDYWPHIWKDPNRARQVADMFVQEAGKQGSSRHLQQRKHLKFSDGLAMGLEPAEKDPARVVINYVNSTFNYIQSRKMLKKWQDDGIVYWATHAKDPINHVPMGGSGTHRPVAKDVEIKLFAPRGLADAWNTWLDQGVNGHMYLKPWQEKLMFVKNFTTQLKLLGPMYHAMSIAVEAPASGIGNALREIGVGLARGDVAEVGRGVKDYAYAQTILPYVAKQTKQGFEILQKFKEGANDDAITYLSEGGLWFGPRQHYYKMGSAPDLITSIVRKELTADWVHHFKRIAERDPQGDVALGQLAGRSVEFVAREASRLMTTTTAPVFDAWIPALKAASAYERMSTYLRQNPTATPEQARAKAREIAQNTDDRLGEMNWDTVFWPKWVKQTLQIGMISPTFVYGALRFLYKATSSAANVATFGKLGTFNETALTTLAGLFMTTAGLHIGYQYMMTGQFPWDTDTPLQDIAGGPRTGGVNEQYGKEPERALLPGMHKELFDLARIGMLTHENPWHLGEAAAHYGMNKLSPFTHLGKAFVTGEDPIGHHVTAGDNFPAFAAQMLVPIFQQTVLDRRRGTAIPEWQSYLGIRQAMPHIGHPDRWLDMMGRVEDRKLTQEHYRARRENRYLETPKPVPPKPSSSRSITPPDADRIRETRRQMGR